MATLLRPDGTAEEVAPAHGESFTLAELQGYVGGYIEAIYLPEGRIMFVNEEGKLRRPVPLPLNRAATVLFWESGGSSLDCVVGPVIVTTRREASEDESGD